LTVVSSFSSGEGVLQTFLLVTVQEWIISSTSFPPLLPCRDKPYLYYNQILLYIHNLFFYKLWVY
jgi:hypothetical protein